MVDQKELFSLIDGLRERGVQYFKQGDLELVVTAQPPPAGDVEDFFTGMPEEKDDAEVDESLLFHSAPSPRS